MVNYGIEKLKFNQPVPAGSELSIKARRLNSLRDLRGVAKAEVQVALEIKDNKKPARDVILLFLYHFA